VIACVTRSPYFFGSIFDNNHLRLSTRKRPLHVLVVGNNLPLAFHPIVRAVVEISKISSARRSQHNSIARDLEGRNATMSDMVATLVLRVAGLSASSRPFAPGCRRQLGHGTPQAEIAV
jgi:hypothetical protein